MGRSTTRRSTSRAGTVKTPADHLGKVARRESCPIYLDESHVLDLEDAVQEHDRTARDLEATRPLRLGAARDEARQGWAVEHPDKECPARVVQAAEDRVYAEDQARLKELRAERLRLEDLVAKTTRLFVFRSLGPKKWTALRDSCPPQQEDYDVWKQQKHEGKPPFSATALAPKLIQAAAIEPTLSEDDVEAMFEGTEWNEAEVGQLYMTALAAQAQHRQPRRR